MCASSRALLHIGLLSLWDRQPSNASPLLLSPAGLASHRGPPYQNALGAVPQDPLTLKLRLDTNDALASSVQRRRYALKVPAAHFYVEIVDRVPLPRCGGGVGGAEPSAASGGCSEAEYPQRSKKSSKRAARRYFRAPQGGGGKYAVAPYKHRLAYAPGGHSPSGRAFRCVGVLGFTPSRFWALLAIQKCHLGDSRAIYAFAKGPAPPAGEMRICPGKRIEKSSCHSGTGALFAGVNGEHQTALSTLPERKQRVQA